MYEKPTITVLSTSEGVYAASGSPECWTINPMSVQNWNGSHHVFEIQCFHSTSVEHISSATDVILEFSSPVVDAYSEFPCTFNGNTVKIHREFHANAYKSGDVMTYKVWVKCIDEPMTKSVACLRADISCTHQTNVQGKFD